MEDHMVKHATESAPLLSPDQWVPFFRSHNAHQQALDPWRRAGGITLAVASAAASVGLIALGLLRFSNEGRAPTFLAATCVAPAGVLIGTHLYTSVRARPDLTQPEHADALLVEMQKLTLDEFIEIQSLQTHQLRIKELLESKLINGKTASHLEDIITTFARLRRNALELELAQGLRTRFATIMTNEVITPSPLHSIRSNSA
jgi:hypothetical protein